VQVGVELLEQTRASSGADVDQQFLDRGGLGEAAHGALGQPKSIRDRPDLEAVVDQGVHAA
jgi:hypothetical protein